MNIPGIMTFIAAAMQETNVWNLCIVFVICLTVCISIGIIAHNLLKFRQSNSESGLAAGDAGKPQSEAKDTSPQKDDKELENLRHNNKMAEIMKQAEADLNTFEAECDKIKDVIKEALSLDAAGLNVSITLKSGGNCVVITSKEGMKTSK